MAAAVLTAHEHRSLNPFRGPDGLALYGLEVGVAKSAAAIDRFAGFFGRTP